MGLDEAEIERLQKEKEELLKTTKSKAEIRKLKREIFLMKNPSVSFFGRFMRGLFNVLANIGDAVLKLLEKVTRPKPQQKVPAQPAQPQYENYPKKKTKSKVKETPKPQEKPKGVTESISDVMSNMEKEMNKFDKFDKF